MRQADRGGIAVVVVVMMPLLVLFAPFVFDGGRGIVARGETQAAADAGALAKAIDCARRIATTDLTPYQTNGAVLAPVAPVCEPSGETTVAMVKTIDLLFTLGGGTREVIRSATATWSTLGRATTVPVAIADCEFNDALLDGTTDIYLYLDDPMPSSGCSSLPGGFGQLEDTDCSTDITVGGVVEGDPGGDLLKIIACITNPTAPALPRDVLVPMYDAAACVDSCSGNGQYPIIGFATFRVTGYTFNGNRFAGDGMTNTCPREVPPGQGPTSSAGRYCIRGDFIRWSTSQGPTGPGDDFGTYVVHLIR